MTGADTQSITGEFRDSGALAKADPEFFDELLRLVLLRTGDIDAHIVPLLDRSLESLDGVEKAVLRLGAAELVHRPDVPYRVVIDEYVELAKLFGGEDGHKYINGVLDRLAHTLRAAEVAARERV